MNACPTDNQPQESYTDSLTDFHWANAEQLMMGTKSAAFFCILIIAGCVRGRAAEPPAGPQSRPSAPNIIVILTDDEGYGDRAGFYGPTGLSTPRYDRFIKEGMRFSDFYVGASVCSPSRAALMTGCYPQRVGLPVVLEADPQIGLSADEKTIPTLLKERGYATACFGKWHLGDRPEFLPTHRGFDEYFGLPYSNDMQPEHPVKKNAFPDLPLIEGEKVIDFNPDLSQITRRYTEKSVSFIERNKDHPFFLYLAHTMPHIPLAVSDRFKDKSGRGLYGDVLLELDWSLGEIIDCLQRNKIDDNTLIIWLSDNGPWLTYGNHAGSPGPLRDGKTTSFDGGFRVPCAMRWPGHIPGNRVCRELATAMDVLPTLVNLTGAKMPERKIDGKDIWPLMAGEYGARSPHKAFFYYNAWSLEAVRSDRWKLVLPHDQYSVIEPGHDGMPGKQAWEHVNMALYDLLNDVAETADVAGEHPDVMKAMLGYVHDARDDLGDGIIQVIPQNKDFFRSRRIYKIPGAGNRPPGSASTPARSWQGE
jgi:arylsulfatase